MQKIPVYRYIRPDGGVSVSTVKPDAGYTELTRLVADEVCVLSDGTAATTCVDTENPGAWAEVADAEQQAEKAAAYDILMGGAE